MRRFVCMWSFLMVGIGVATSTIASEAPGVRPVPIPLNHVKIEDAFWSPKFKTWRTVTIKDCLDKFEKDGAFRNFDHVARGELDAPHGGPPWYDGLVYELIRGAADLLAQEPDPALEARIDQPRRVGVASVYWWADGRLGRHCIAPTSRRLVFRKPDGTWEPVRRGTNSVRSWIRSIRSSSTPSRRQRFASRRSSGRTCRRESSSGKCSRRHLRRGQIRADLPSRCWPSTRPARSA